MLLLLRFSEGRVYLPCVLQINRTGVYFTCFLFITFYHLLLIFLMSGLGLGHGWAIKEDISTCTRAVYWRKLQLKR